MENEHDTGCTILGCTLLDELEIQAKKEKEEWLRSLSVGDEVIVRDAQFDSENYIDHVRRLTHTYIVVGDHNYWNTSGRRYRGEEMLEKPTPERVAEINHYRISQNLRLYNFARLPQDALLKIWETVSNGEKCQEKEGGIK